MGAGLGAGLRTVKYSGSYYYVITDQSDCFMQDANCARARVHI